MRLAVLLPALLATLLQAAPQGPASRTAAPQPERGIRADLPGQLWRGNAIAYSGYRRGQSPHSGVHPSQEQVAEDLRILERNWRLIRVYGSGRNGEDVLEVIRREGIDLKVMLGIWLGREPDSRDANAREIASGIRLAREYRDIVAAVSVGNEALIEWTDHPVSEEQVIRYLRRVKEAVAQPVTVADNYVWWRDHGSALAREVDFITIHTYPLWERKDIDEGLSYTVENYEGVRAAHPGRTIVIGEAGWATYTEGNLHVPRGGDEEKQRRYYDELTDWARKNRVTVFFFEAFDEPWKGTGTEGHWGLFTEDRKAKPVMQELYPDLMPDGPTSPSYPDRIVPSGPDISAVLRADPGGEIRHGSVNPLGPGLSAAEVLPVAGAGGGTALRLRFTGESWGGVYLMFDSFDATGAGTLAMRLKLPPAVADLELKLEGPPARAQSVNLIDYETARDAEGWRSFSVPLSHFDRIDLSELGIIGLWKPFDETRSIVAGDMILDDIHFGHAGPCGDAEGPR